MKKIQNYKKGFSFIEVIVTLFIVGVVLVLYQAAAGTMRLMKTAKSQEIALRVANNEIEKLRAGGYASLPTSGGFSDPQLSALSNGSGSLTVTAFNSDTKQVLVSIQWQNPGDSSARSVSLTTLVTKTGGL